LCHLFGGSILLHAKTGSKVVILGPALAAIDPERP
jgi:hypothetical protein